MKDDIHLTEEEQVERLKQWLKTNGGSILFGIVLGISAIFGYQFWQKTKVDASRASSDVYQTLVDGESLDLAIVKEKSTVLKDKYKSTPYAVKGAFLSAKHHVENQDLEGAQSELQWIIANAKDDFSQHVARTRLGSILVENGDADSLEKLIAINDKGEFSAKYKELSADSQRLQGNFTEAKKLYEEVLDLLDNAPYSQVIKLRINQVSAEISG